VSEITPSGSVSSLAPASEARSVRAELLSIFSSCVAKNLTKYSVACPLEAQVIRRAEKMYKKLRKCLQFQEFDDKLIIRERLFAFRYVIQSQRQ